MYTETQKINALQMGMELYRTCAAHPHTALAAFGIAVSIVSTVLHVSISVACYLVDEELKRQGH